jgi:DNA-binding MarR family transcriptional regulator
MDMNEQTTAAFDVALLLSQVSALLARAGGRALAARGVTWPQALSLIVLARHQGPISATRLVEQLGLGRTAMTSVVDRLERHGWVERRPSPTDRRTADLLLTERGRELVADIGPVLHEVARTSIAAAVRRDLAHLVTDLNRLRDGLTDTLD